MQTEPEMGEEQEREEEEEEDEEGFTSTHPEEVDSVSPSLVTLVSQSLLTVVSSVSLFAYINLYHFTWFSNNPADSYHFGILTYAFLS